MMMSLLAHHHFLFNFSLGVKDDNELKAHPHPFFSSDVVDDNKPP
jgi:hypothetical protein